MAAEPSPRSAPSHMGTSLCAGTCWPCTPHTIPSPKVQWGAGEGPRVIIPRCETCLLEELTFSVAFPSPGHCCHSSRSSQPCFWPPESGPKGFAHGHAGPNAAAAPPDGLPPRGRAVVPGLGAPQQPRPNLIPPAAAEVVTAVTSQRNNSSKRNGGKKKTHPKPCKTEIVVLPGCNI